MRGHIDENTPGTNRRRNKASNVRHGFGSPAGMELTDHAAASQSPSQSDYAPPSSWQSLQALADLESPPPPILTMSTESESQSQSQSQSQTPTPPAMETQAGRQTPPDASNPSFADQLMGRRPPGPPGPHGPHRVVASPPRDTPAMGAIRPPPAQWNPDPDPDPVPPSATMGSRRLSPPVSSDPKTTTPAVATRLFVSPIDSVFTPPITSQRNGPTSSRRMVSTPALAVPPTPSFLSPTPAKGRVDPIHMGTPTSAARSLAYFSDQKTGNVGQYDEHQYTPEGITPVSSTRSDGYDSASDASDTSVKERLTDQVESLNDLLLSTDKRLGKLGHTSFSPDKDNDDLEREEQELEAVRRQLQQELLAVDYSVLEETPDNSPEKEDEFGFGGIEVREWNDLIPDIVGQSPTTSAASTPESSRKSSLSLRDSQSPSVRRPPERTPTRSNRERNLTKTVAATKLVTTPDRSVASSMEGSQYQKMELSSPLLERVTAPRVTPPTDATTPSSHGDVGGTIAAEDSAIEVTISSPPPRQKIVTETPPDQWRSQSTPSPGGSSTPAASLFQRLGLHSRKEKPHVTAAADTSSPIASMSAMKAGDLEFSASAANDTSQETNIFKSLADFSAEHADPLPPQPIELRSIYATRSSNLVPTSSKQAQTIRLLEQQLDTPTTAAKLQPAQELRRPTPPEPKPKPADEALDSKIARVGISVPVLPSSQHDYSKGDSESQALYSSVDHLFSPPSPMAFPEDEVGTRETTAMFASQQQPKRQQKAPEPPTTDVMPNQRLSAVSIPPPSRSPQSPRGSRATEFMSAVGSLIPMTFPDDNRENSREDLLANTFKRSDMHSTSLDRRGCRPFDQSPSPPNQEQDEPANIWAVETTPEIKGTRQRDSNWLLRTIGDFDSPSQQPLSPIVYEDDNPEKDSEVVTFSEDVTPPKVLFDGNVEDETFAFDPAKMPNSYSMKTVEIEEQKTSNTSYDSPENKGDGAKRMRLFCVLCFVLLGIGLGLGIGLSGLTSRALPIGRDPTEVPSFSPSVSSEPSVLPSTETPVPSTSPWPSLNSTISAAPSTSFASMLPSLSPTSGPTPGTVSFETEYEIVIDNGKLEDVSQEDYEFDLIESMDRLLMEVLNNLPQEFDQSRRKLTYVLLPSTINDFTDTRCPDGDSDDRCERVTALVTLQDAEDTWVEFELILDVAIAIGMLQFQLDQVNPNSPVGVIDAMKPSSSAPTPIESSSPSISVSPTAVISSLPTMSIAPSIVAPTTFPVDSPTMSPSMIATTDPTEFDIFGFLVENSYDDGEALMDKESPQHQSYLWLLRSNSGPGYSEVKLLQRYAMATFYYSTNGDDWFTNSLWLSDFDECIWYSRSARSPCTQDGLLQNLEVDFNNLNGVLPPELGLLSGSLERLVLRGGPTSLSEGSIPSELGYLTLMKLFSIRGNRYSGTIPPELGAWTGLEQFDAAGNMLTGPIPTEFGSFQELYALDLSINSLDGDIPSELGSLTRCQRLILENNILSGPIPSEIGYLRRLQSLRAGSNMLSSLPAELGLLTFMDTLSLYENDIGGTIPTELSRLRRLIILELGNNVLTGQIPSQLGNLFDMRDRIDLSYNHLSGSLPSELGNLDRLRVLELHHNKISGVVPPEISGLSRATTIRFDTNDLTGEIPVEVCAVFNQTMPAFHGDCAEFADGCPCCTTCCQDDGTCECQHLGTPQEFLCYQQRHF